MSSPEIQQKVTNLGLIPLNPPSIPDTETYIKSETEKLSVRERQALRAMAMTD